MYSTSWHTMYMESVCIPNVLEKGKLMKWRFYCYFLTADLNADEVTLTFTNYWAILFL